MWGRTIDAGVRETMRNPSVNNYEAKDGTQFWIVGIEGDRHWPALARGSADRSGSTIRGSQLRAAGP